jgi:hypothetical protein
VPPAREPSRAGDNDTDVFHRDFDSGKRVLACCAAAGQQQYLWLSSYG